MFKIRDLIIKTGVALVFSIVSTAKQASPGTVSLTGSESPERFYIQPLNSGFKILKSKR